MDQTCQANSSALGASGSEQRNDYSLIVYRTDIPKPGGSVNLYNGRSQDISRAINPNLGTSPKLEFLEAECRRLH